ncbi:MAG: hypothetical protein KME29_09985 [Calothrix sp. FI2-JRJ7]|jgi:hypothetical protein|nr:hypothetical protein [Calothrix sp. FI2-JRJ7]
MTESYSHKWGQIIGNLIQEFIRETLQEVALAHEKSRVRDATKKLQRSYRTCSVTHRLASK